MILLKKIRKKAFAFLLLAVILVGLFIFVRHRVRPYVAELAWIKGKELASDALEDAIVTVFGEEKLSYGELVELKHSSTGDIVSVETNTAKLNLLRGKISLGLSESLKKLSSGMRLEIPVGSFFGIFFTGRGLSFEFRLDSINTTDVDFISEFVSAGINQTLHRILLKVKVEFTVLVASYKVKAESYSKFSVCETVIVGKVPEVYFGSNDAEENLSEDA